MKYKLIVLVLLLAMLGIIPTLAQETATHNVSYNGFSFSLDGSLANNINITQYPGDPAELGPGGAEVKHTAFTFYNQFPVPESIFDSAGGIRVYNTADFAGYTEVEARFQALQNLLTEKPDLASYTTAESEVLPFIPVFPAGQTIRARAQYVETDAVKGISYLTAYQEAAEPLLSDTVFFTFQGFSTDGQHYITVIIKLNTSLFPAEMSADFDMATFVDNLPAYLNDSMAQLNAAASDAFSPSLTTLDSLVASFQFGA
ncbi:MAG: hypothetical protein K8L97_10100 [Anaerolineae bacterium]|nr:hypothetical protein [Anaerolineae bacterium]